MMDVAAIDYSPLYLFGLFNLALVAGLIDAMAGGGGLLTVPGLLATGLPPVVALATNKAQGIFSSLSACFHFWRKGQIVLKDYWQPALAALVAGALGAASLNFIDPSFLRKLVPFLLISIALWLLFSPKLGDVPRHARLTAGIAALTLVPLVAYYDGLLGPGTGTFFALSLVAWRGLRLDQATVEAKLYNLMSNFGSLIFFLLQGQIIWAYAGVMALGMIIGGNLGARLILSHGTKFIKPLLVIMSLAMSIKLLIKD